MTSVDGSLASQWAFSTCLPHRQTHRRTPCRWPCAWSQGRIPREGREESVSGTHPFHLQPHVFVARQHLFEFVLAQQSVVNENAVQLLADGPVQQGGSYGSQLPAQSEDDLVAPI